MYFRYCGSVPRNERRGKDEISFIPFVMEVGDVKRKKAGWK
jgi:hypothetical protein